MRLRTVLQFLAIPMVLLLVSSVPGLAIPTIRLKITRVAVLNDGRDSAEIVADVFNSDGRFVSDGTVVKFETNNGQFNRAGLSANVPTRSGTARVRISSFNKGTARITASIDTGGMQTAELVFTDDPTETFEGNSYVSVQALGTLLYSAEDRIIQAKSRPDTGEKPIPPDAMFDYRGVQITADDIQVSSTSNEVRAAGRVNIRRGNTRLVAAKLYYNFQTGTGYAITEINGRLKSVKFSGNDFKIEVPENGVAPKQFEMADLTEAKLVVLARHILLFPGDKLQFKRPAFYQDGAKLIDMPFYSLGIFSNQLFTDQFLSVGSQGLGVNMPLYFDMTPQSTGLFRFRYGDRAGSSVYATRPGFAIDAIQSYNSLGSSNRHSGEFGFTNLSRSDWGFRWTHSQEFSQSSQGSFFLDFPQHRGVFGSSNFAKRFDGINVGLNMSANHSLQGFRQSGIDGDAYIETTPRKVGKTGYMMALSANTGYSHIDTPGLRLDTMHRGVQARMYSQPYRLDKNTTVTNYLSVGQLWANQGASGETYTASLTANRTLGTSANLSLTYDFAKQPLLYNLGGGNHRLAATFFAGGGQKWNLYLYSSTMLDSPQSSFSGEVNYLLDKKWRLNLSATMQSFAAASYRDYLMGLAYNLGGRDVVISYSTFTHRIFFDIEASRF